MKIPNMLTLLRFFLIPVIIFLIYSSNSDLIFVSLIIFVFAVITDYFDGLIARKFNQKSVFGTFFDPIVDKLLILSIFFVFSNLGLISIWIPLLFLFRELFVTGIRQVGSTKEKIVGANWMGKSKFILQFLLAVQIYLYFYFQRVGINSLLFNQIAVNWFSWIVVIISLLYAFIFLYWYRELLLKDL